jgi:integrase
MLTMYGLRRGEVLGLRWDDVDLQARTLTVKIARTDVAGTVISGDPKSSRSKRTLPLDVDLITALCALRLRQHDEAGLAGSAYMGSGYVVVDEQGVPYRPEWYSDTFQKLAASAALNSIRLHDARHTCGTLMHLRGVPITVISAWLGHASAAFTMKTYVHSQDDALRAAGATLAGALGAAA